MADPFASFKNSWYWSLGMVNLPEFRGKPGEDLEKFLQDFGRATAALTGEQKCLALKRSLVGDAALFLKKYLKPQILQGNWKDVKVKLRERFSQVEPGLLYRTQLRRMTFDPAESTLLGYIDKYEKLYKRIHSEARDNELIQDLSLNLGKNIVLKLNQLSSDWRSATNFESFRSLVARLERDITSLETDLSGQNIQGLTATVNQLVTTALQAPVKEIQEILASLKNQTQPEISKEKAAAVRYTHYPSKNEHNPGKRRDRDWEDQPGTNRNLERGPEVGPISKRARELKKAYEEKFGTISGPCFYCGGQHFRRHCPLDMPDLKDRGNRQ